MPAQTRVLDFGDGTFPIQLNYPDQKIFSNCNSYGDRVPGLNWNEITVHHRGQFKSMSNPHQIILDGLYQAVDGAEFFPVFYQRGNYEDTFLVRNCKAAIDNLFNLRLTISVNSGATFDISVQLGVAQYQRNQISPHLLIAQVVNRLMRQLVKKNGVERLLNLDSFGEHPEFRNIVVSLGNPSILMNVCQVIRNDTNSFRVNGFILSNNNIRNVRPLTLFANVDYALLDLSNNKIKSAERFCRALEEFRAEELFLENNPIVKTYQFPENIRMLKKNFKLVNGRPFDMLHEEYSPLDNDIDLETDGSRLDSNNTWKLSEYTMSQDWHAFMVPDPQQEFSKDAFFDFFFIRIEATLSEFYPCYYKYIKNEHVFLVRNCFDQISSLVNTYNLEMWIPPTVSFPEERIFKYYLRMNVSTYKKHHIDPKECIQKAVQLCYVPQNRLLNLDKFQSNESLKNVVVSLSSPKILTSVLSMASRQFMANCSEIRLCCNKIVTVDGAHVLRRMGNLRAVDLSHNWLHDLSVIKSLGELPLKSLVLHGNQLCRNYSLPSEYIRAVMELCPQLTTLDGVDLQTNPGQSPQKNFLCDIGAYELIGGFFLKNYLREFEDNEDRGRLHKYYTNDSIFTLTCNYSVVQNHQTSHMLRRIAKYNKHARNLLKNDFSKAANSVYVGTDEILEVLAQLPKVTHDFHSLQTDVMHYDGSSAVIYVTGLLRDEEPSKNAIGDVFLGFSRQFVVKFDTEGLGLGKRARRLKITNERLNIMRPSTNMIRNAFSVQYPDPSEHPREDDSLDVKDHKLLLFQEVTGLISTWCTSIVEQADWDFERALKLFIQKNQDQEIPDLAFA
ncbi:LOW QUALITY PROTEIN: nuclear RNA export factor 2 [Drosophila ficusphila]|uniref:LOW QUALITY PROTEIN: nuclear RNA export factor 2 n=1 Tax=Drosophila ficusphila TaxID=30025 RepID=UPI0007E863AF|nr:LOW QUALITY PROTEIN: nuclear RNA export factor 2 [Drosophila ficusphila]